jgi:hypothetical protein
METIAQRWGMKVVSIGIDMFSLIKFEAKVKGRLGPGKTDDKSTRVLNGSFAGDRQASPMRRIRGTRKL